MYGKTPLTKMKKEKYIEILSIERENNCEMFKQIYTNNITECSAERGTE